MQVFPFGLRYTHVGSLEQAWLLSLCENYKQIEKG